MKAVPRWHDTWQTAFGMAPTRPSSREESSQAVLSSIFLGLSPAYFLEYKPTADGCRAINAIWRATFDTAPAEGPDWLVSEYELPVPEEWRPEIKLSYRAPDFACRSGNHLLIIELKTESGSYQQSQITDFLRLARRKHPEDRIDLILVEEHRRGVRVQLDAGQRFAELTWAQMATLLQQELPEHGLVKQARVPRSRRQPRQP